MPNMRRGFLRLWLVLSVLFIVAFASVQYGNVQREFAKAAAIDNARNRIDSLQFSLPVICKDARGTVGVDFTTKLGQEPGPWDNYYRLDGVCYYSIVGIRKLYPEYNDLTYADLSQRLRERVGRVISEEARPQPWKLVGTAVAWAIGIPLIVLVLGASMGWVFYGFKRET